MLSCMFGQGANLCFLKHFPVLGLAQFVLYQITLEIDKEDTLLNVNAMSIAFQLCAFRIELQSRSISTCKSNLLELHKDMERFYN